MARDPIEIRRHHLQHQLGPEVARRLSRVDYLRILRAEREGRQVHITVLNSGKMKITSSLRPPVTSDIPLSTSAEMRSVAPWGLLAAGMNERITKPIAYPPGHHSLRFLQFLFSQHTYDRLFVQIAADEREEHAAALSNGHKSKARWIELRIHLLLVWAAILWMAVAVGKQIWSIWKLGS